MGGQEKDEQGMTYGGPCRGMEMAFILHHRDPLSCWSVDRLCPKWVVQYSVGS